MKLFNQLLNSNLNVFNQLSLLLFSILPVSLIFGNGATNINIILIDLLFLIYCFKFREWNWMKKNVFFHLLTLYIFLNLNSLYSYFILFENQTPPFWDNGVLKFYNEDAVLKFYNNDGIIRSFLFIKFILLVFAFSALLKNEKVLTLVHKAWIIIVVVVLLDVFYEKFTGQNILGYSNTNYLRIVSFFKDEAVAGTYIFCFGYASITYFINNKRTDKPNLLIALIFLLIPLSIFITGEKSIFIKSMILFFIIIYFIRKHKFNINYKIITFSLFFLISCFVMFSDNTRQRYYETFKRVNIISLENKAEIKKEVKIDLKKNVKTETMVFDRFQNIIYFAHYDTAIKIFMNYPITGIGNKNFRIECFKDKYFNERIFHSPSRCSTHPHQIHFEILSEQGILGYLIILFFIVWFSIKNLKISIKIKNLYQLSNASYLLIFFIPLLPGGGIFSTFNGTLFWVIFSLVNLSYEKK